MVRAAEKRSLRPASCCRVEVINGGCGVRRHGRSSTERTENVGRSNRSASPRAASSSRRTTSRGIDLAVLAEVPPADQPAPVEGHEGGTERLGWRLFTD